MKNALDRHGADDFGAAASKSMTRSSARHQQRHSHRRQPDGVGRGRRRCGARAPGTCRPCASDCIWCWWRASRSCPRARCPTWSMRSGNFRNDMARAGAAMFFLPKVRAPAGSRDRSAVRSLRRHRPDARSCQRAQAFPSASHHRRADGEDRQAPWRQGRARAAGAAEHAGADRAASRLRHRGAAPRLSRARLRAPFPPRRHRRARSGVRPGLVRRDDARRGSRG